jgi:hypothetical protein
MAFTKSQKKKALEHVIGLGDDHNIVKVLKENKQY